MNNEFYEDAFEGYNVPKDIWKTAVEICETFGINGSADPMYISNVIAKETETGDGAGNFYGNTLNSSKLLVVKDRLMGAYSTCIKESGEKTEKMVDIIQRNLG